MQRASSLVQVSACVNLPFYDVQRFDVSCLSRFVVYHEAIILSSESECVVFGYFPRVFSYMVTFLDIAAAQVIVLDTETAPERGLVRGQTAAVAPDKPTRVLYNETVHQAIGSEESHVIPQSRFSPYPAVLHRCS